MRKGFTVLAILMVLISVCGCIGGNSTTTEVPTTTVAPTTVPPNVNTTPIYASDLQESAEEAEAAYEATPVIRLERLETLLALLDATDPDYDEIYEAYTDYEAAAKEYENALYGYWHTSILLEHVTPIEGDLLALRKDTIPFDRPDGDTYTYGALNMEGEGYHYLTDMVIKRLILEGINGEDTREEIIEGLGQFEAFLPGYREVIIGYMYYDLNYILSRQETYSDILIHDCNPYCLS